MRIRPRFKLPADKATDLEYLVRLEWINLGFRFSIVAVLFLVLGNSQAMKAAWLEDTLTLAPPIAFLIALHFRRRSPDATFPYGYHRAGVIAFLCAAVVLSTLGLYLIIDSGMKLIKQEHTSIGGIKLMGHTIWLGWLMIAALIYSVIPPLILGRLQERAAEKVHDKTVHVDGKVSKADWMTGAAGVVGVLGVGMGWWWADAAAALVIGLDVSRDGYKNLKEAAGDLLDRRPHSILTGKPEDLPEKLEQELRSLDWVAEAAVRLREEGDVLSGEAFIVPASHEDLVARTASAKSLLENYDWRIYEVVVSMVPTLDPKLTDN